MSDCVNCGGEIDEEMAEAEDRFSLKLMTHALKQNPDLARALWLVLKLAGEQPQ